MSASIATPWLIAAFAWLWVNGVFVSALWLRKVGSVRWANLVNALLWPVAMPLILLARLVFL